MNGRLIVRNSIREHPLDLKLLRRIVQTLLRDLLQQKVVELGIYVVAGTEMTGLNETFLRHRGSTDVITFDYKEALAPESIQGEIFVCLDEARVQARRFRGTWQNELVRYIVHGLLHLGGYDDRRKTDRVRMKRRENQLLRQLARRFPLEKLQNSPDPNGSKGIKTKGNAPRTVETVLRSAP